MVWQLELPGNGDMIDRKTVENLLRYMGEDLDFLDKNEEGWSTKAVEGKCKIVPTENGFDIDMYVGRISFRYSNDWHQLGDPEVARCQKLVPYKL